MRKPTISIVAPVYNEEVGIQVFIDEVVKVMRSQTLSWELLLVNDGSADRTLDLVKKAKQETSEIEWVELSRNFGHQAAVTAAITHARGKAVVVMDADMQDPPSLIPKLIDSWQNGNQVVFARRTDRAETGLRRIGFEVFHKLFRYTIDFPIPEDVGVFSLLDRSAVDEINLLPERNRFLPGLYSWVGFQQGFVDYARDERAEGEPKQTLKSLIKYAFDGVLSFSYKPMRLLGVIGFLTALGAACIAVYFIVKRLIGIETADTGFTTLVVLISGLGGLILVAVALVGEYVGRIYDEVKNRPAYIVRSSSLKEQETEED